MPKSAPSLNDKFDLGETHQLLTGSQAIVRLTLMQRARDTAAGLNTACYVSGYRGSPIAGLEGAFQRAESLLAPNHIKFHPGLNEDLAATAIWGSQQAELVKGDAKYDGVFGIWYGKGPGVDRTGDVFRHANHAGTSKHGGVIALMGDDHTCESSTSAHQSEFAMVDFMIPVLNPAGVQELLDFGIVGFALSRFAGVWVGLKCVKDNIESTAVVDGSLDRVKIVLPSDFVMPEGGLNIRLHDTAVEKEARLHDHKRRAILEFKNLHIPRSLVRAKRNSGFRFTIDAAFPQVIGACAAIPRVHDGVIELNHRLRRALCRTAPPTAPSAQTPSRRSIMEQRKNPATSSQAANPGRDEGKASAHGAQGGNKGASGQSQSGQNQSGQNQSGQNQAGQGSDRSREQGGRDQSRGDKGGEAGHGDGNVNQQNRGTERNQGRK